MNAILPPMNQEEYDLLNEFLTEQFGISFPEQKREILESRLRGRIVELRMKSFMDYYVHLLYNGRGELSNLARLVTNNETYFFRETHQFDAMFEHALPTLKESLASPGVLRILSAGCSSGEEPYTLNAFVKDNQYRMWGITTEIDAFDVDDKRIAMAKAAEYGPSSLRSLTPPQTTRLFNAHAAPGSYSLKELYRSGVSFKLGNILRFETWGQVNRYDAVFCRNVLIYFSEPMLHKAIQNFALCLRPGGLLFLGHSESIIGVSSAFETVRIGDCIVYRKI